MKNYPYEAHILYSGYRGEPLEASSNFQESSPESYYPSSEGRYQQQEQHYEYQQQGFAPPVGYAGLYEKVSPNRQAPRAIWLSYLGGWVTGLIFLLLKRENRIVRFHAMQSLIFFGAMSIVTAIFSSVPFFASIATGLGFVTFICWLVLMVKAARGRYYKLPIIGDYAEKWANSLGD